MKMSQPEPNRPRATFRLMACLFAVLVLQLAVAFEVWRAEWRVDDAALADTAAQAATAKVQNAVLALQVTETRLSRYLLTQAVTDRQAFDAQLTRFGEAIGAAAVNANTGLALKATLGYLRSVLAEIIAANDSARAIAGQLLQATAALDNGVGALAAAAGRADTPAILEAALNTAAPVARLLAAGRSYAASFNPRDADRAREAIGGSTAAVSAMLQAAGEPAPDRLRRVAGAISRALEAFDGPIEALSQTIERRDDASQRLAVATANAREVMRNAQDQINQARASGLSEMADAKLTMRRTVLFSAGFATLLALALTGLVGGSKYRSIQLEHLANRDPLTGLANRRAATALIDRLWKDRRIAKTSIAFIMADIDHFKGLNDSAGHGAGDVCLQRVARAIEKSLRHEDALFRYGGEEFLIILGPIEPDVAFALADRIRAAVEALGIENPGIAQASGGPGLVTLSLGVAFGRDDAAPEQVAKWADEALYDAKRSGRNAVFLSNGQAGDNARYVAAAPPGDASPPLANNVSERRANRANIAPRC